MFKQFLILLSFTLVFDVTSSAQTTLFFQSGNPGDSWNFSSTGSDETAAAQALNNLNFTSAPQSLVVGGNTGGGSCIDGGSGNGPSVLRTFTFEEVNISSSNQLNRTLSFKWGNRHPVCTGTGWDSGENLIFIPIHNGIEQASQTLATGGSDAIFSIHQNNFTYVVPPCVNTFGFILYISTNRRDELLFLDDVSLSTPGFNQPLSPNIVNQNICQNQLPFLWNNQNITQAGTYNASLITTAGCDSLVQLNVSILPVPESTDQLSICQSELPLSINGTLIENAGVYNLIYSASSGCDSLVTITVSILPSEQSFQQIDICENQLPLIINNIEINSSGTYNFNFQSETGCDSIATFIVSVKPSFQSTVNIAVCPNEIPFQWNGQTITESGNYSANLLSSSGCDSVVTLNFLIKPIPTINISADNTTVFADNPVVNFTNNSLNFDQFIWNFGDDSPAVDAISPTHTFPNSPGVYNVQASAALNNCSTSSSIEVTVLENASFEYILPNVFTPNADGSNDLFSNNVINAKSMELTISNRWGNIVFQTKDALESWNGKILNTGEDCFEGVYFYKLVIEDKNNAEHVFNSIVHLVR